MSKAPKDTHDIRDLLTETVGEEDTMPTFIDRYIEQGRQQGLFVGRQEGEQAGLQKGLQEGLQTGLQQGQRETLLRQLARKFGKLPADQRRRVQQADSETLLRWSEQVLFAASLEDALR